MRRAGLISPPFPTPVPDHTKDPDWTFTVFVPGHCMPKGSPEAHTRKFGNTRKIVIIDKTEVRLWMAAVAAHALQVRNARVARGERSFPYNAPMKLWSAFIFERPRTQPEGPPIVASGGTTKEGVKAAIGDLDKLIRAIPDALIPGRISLDDHGKHWAPKASVIRDDCLITRMGEPVKAFRDEAGGVPAGAYFKLTRAPEDPIDMSLYT